MSYLPVITPKRLIKALKKIGFEEDHQEGSHLILRHVVDRRRTVVPVHCRDLPKGTLKGILKDIGLDVEELKRLV